MTSKESGQVLTLKGDLVEGSTPLAGASAAACDPTGHVVSGYDILQLGGREVAATEGFEFDNHGLSLSMPS